MSRSTFFKCINITELKPYTHWSITPHLFSPILWNPHALINSMNLMILNTLDEWHHAVFTHLWWAFFFAVLMSLRFIHIVKCRIFIFLKLNNVCVHTHAHGYVWCVLYPSTGGHLGYFHILAIVYSATMKMGMLISPQNTVLILFG